MIMPWHPSLETDPDPEDEELESLVAEYEAMSYPEIEEMEDIWG